MVITNNLWNLGAQFMASIQARDRTTAHRLLEVILSIIAIECGERFALYKLRTLQVLTNANRAAFNAGASTHRLEAHSCSILERIDQLCSHNALQRFVHKSVDLTINVVPTTSAYDERTIQEAIGYIQDHFAEALSRPRIARRLQCSEAHFSRLFAKTTGYTFRDYLVQCRLEKAKTLLSQSRLRVGEIAAMVGYDDPFRFSKIFRSRVGVSPRQFRESKHQQ